MCRTRCCGVSALSVDALRASPPSPGPALVPWPDQSPLQAPSSLRQHCPSCPPLLAAAASPPLGEVLPVYTRAQVTGAPLRTSLAPNCTLPVRAFAENRVQGPHTLRLVSPRPPEPPRHGGPGGTGNWLSFGPLTSATSNTRLILRLHGRLCGEESFQLRGSIPGPQQNEHPLLRRPGTRRPRSVSPLGH